jgi:1-acyl-sn-glycerol-3-phosphate acyltransferase
MGPRLISALSRFLLGLFYRRIEVVGLERVPRTGGLILAANHHNALVDPMLIASAIPRACRPLAKAPLFSHPLIAPFLLVAGGIPVRRRVDEKTEDTGRNTEMFAAVGRVLGEGGAIMIFPEGTTQPEPRLMTIKTGTARMFLEAAERGVSVTLLPVGLLFQDPGTFRGGAALVLVGEPVPTANLPADREAAARDLTERLDGALRTVIVEADDRETLRLLRAVEALSRDRRERSSGEEVAYLQGSVRAYRRWLAKDKERVLALRRRLETFAADLEAAGLAEHTLAESYPPGLVLRYGIERGLSLCLGLPLALLGIAINILPYELTRLLTRLLGRSDEEEATDKIAAGVLLYPLFWLAEGWALARTTGGGALVGALFAPLALLSGFFALSWSERWERFRRDSRGFLVSLLRGDLHKHLLAEKRSLALEIAALSEAKEG